MFNFQSHHPMIYVYDLNRAVDFYKNILGFNVRFQHGEFFASLIHPNTNLRIDLHPTEANGKDVGFGTIVYFDSKNFDQTFEYLKNKNVKVGTPKTEGDSGRFVTFYDSEGNALGLEEIKE